MKLPGLCQKLITAAELAQVKTSMIHLLWHKTLMTNVAWHYRGMDFRRGQKSSCLAMRVLCSSSSIPLAGSPLRVAVAEETVHTGTVRKLLPFAFRRLFWDSLELVQPAHSEHILVINTTVKKEFQELSQSDSVENLTSVRWSSVCFSSHPPSSFIDIYHYWSCTHCFCTTCIWKETL